MNNMFEALDDLRLLDESLDDIFGRFYADKMSREDFDRVIALDPTFKSDKDKMGTYGKWLLTLFQKGEDLSDVTEIKDSLDSFTRFKSTFPEEKRDINRIKTIEELIALVRDSDGKSEYQAKVEKIDGVEFICKNEGWEVYSPLTRAASIKLRDDTSFNGYDANWCTGDHRSAYYWNEYTEDGGKLFIFLNKNATDEHDAKYQVCVRDGHVVDFRDARDYSYSFTKFLKETNLYELLGNTTIGLTKEFIAVNTMAKSGGKITYSMLMGLKYNTLGGSSNNSNSTYQDIVNLVKIIIVDNGVRYIPAEVFQGYPVVEKIILPDTVKVLGSECFSKCEHLKSIYINEGVSVIPSKCFSDCKSLVMVKLPSTVTSINAGAFTGCPNSLRIVTPRHKIKIMNSELKFFQEHIQWDESTVEEALELEEDLSRRIPAWLDKFLTDNAKRTRNSSYHNSSSIISHLADNGINPNTMVVKNAKVPENARDPMFTNPDIIPIFYIPRDKLNELKTERDYWGIRNDRDYLYIPGIWDDKFGYNETTRFSKMAKARLLKGVTKCGYIEKSRAENFIDTDKIRRDRVDSRQGSVDRDLNKGQRKITDYEVRREDGSVYNRFSSDSWGAENWLGPRGKQNLKAQNLTLHQMDSHWEDSYKTHYGNSYDKSGYPIPTVSEFKIKLNAVHKNNYAAVLDKYHDNLIEVKNKISDLITNDLGDIDNLSDSGVDVSDLYSSLKTCISLYRRILERLDYILLLDDEERKEKEIDKLFTSSTSSSDSRLFPTLDDKIKELNKKIKDIQTTYIESLKK